VIPLTAADPDFPVCPAIRQAMVDYIDGGNLCYGPAEGLPDFREACARHLRENRNIDCSADQILAADSAASAMLVVARYALKPGDEAIIFDPVDFLFKASVEAAGGKTVLSPVSQDEGRFDLEHLESLINERTRMIGVCNPHNPLGLVMRRETLEAIGQLAVKHDLWIMSDEIWSDIVYAPHQYTSMASISPEIAERTLTVYGFSKSYGLAGLRVGFLMAPNAKVFDELMQVSTAPTTMWGAATISQVAVVAALEKAGDWFQEFLAHLTRQRDMAVDRLNNIPGVKCRAPEGTYVLFPDITAFGMDCEDLTKYLLDEGRVAVVPGGAQWVGPGAEGHIRIAFPTSRGILSEGLDRIEAALTRL
jgi:aspartate/methionine/tyrosine aminotransferase